MQDLFGYSKTNSEVTIDNAQEINGLKLYFDFISKAEENQLMMNIDNQHWLSDLKRRVQHYGYKYDYRARRIDSSSFIGEIPIWMNFLIERLGDQKLISFRPDQAIVNEYVDDQGIAAHIDCEPCFGDTIISISLGSSCVMNFQRDLHTKEQNKIPLFLQPRTLVVMTKESRFNWYHGIPSRKSDKFNEQVHKRQRRVSITFRKINLASRF
jgi:alkylated DNA repair dioxygenase AlkB